MHLSVRSHTNTCKNYESKVTRFNVRAIYIMHLSGRSHRKNITKNCQRVAISATLVYVKIRQVTRRCFVSIDPRLRSTKKSRYYKLQIDQF